jgi:pyruvate/2-oxoglutarate dehydrogenase complex dihydrolipoamide acyltransferase (E2) component
MLKDPRQYRFVHNRAAHQLRYNDMMFVRPTYPPECNNIAMGKIQRLPRFVDDESDAIESVRIMPISWGGDHRAVDGATMARFSNLWKSYCENPSSMMFAMR